MRCIGPIEVKWAYILFFFLKTHMRCSGPTGQQWYLLFLYFFYFVHKLFLDAMQWTDWAAVGLTSLVLAFAIADDVQQGTLSLSLSLSHTHTRTLSLPLSPSIYLYMMALYVHNDSLILYGRASFVGASEGPRYLPMMFSTALSFSLSFFLSFSLYMMALCK